MEKAIDFLKRELGDLERLMKAIESAMERKQGTPESAPAPEPVQREKAGVSAHETPVSLWVD